MYKSILASIVFMFIVTGHVFCQGVFSKKYLVKTDGEVIKYKRSVENSDHILLRLSNMPNSEEIIVNVNEVLGYYYEDNAMQYLLRFESNDGNDEYSFAERLLGGKIEVFQETTESYGSAYIGTGGTINTRHETHDLYARIDNEYVQLYPVGKKHEEGVIKKFKKAISDDAFILEQVQDEKFKFNYDNIIELLEEYNVRAHQPVNFSSISDSSNTILFRMNTQQTKEPVSIKLGESTYSLLPKDLIRVYIPTNQPVKLCFGNSEIQLCKLIIGSEYFDKSIELSLQKNGIMGLTTEELSPYQIIDLEKIKKKRAKKAAKAKAK